MTIDEINIRDPFILTEDNVYYMYGSRPGGCQAENVLDVYTSRDMINWSKPKTIVKAEGLLSGIETFWAPEVYKYDGMFYMFVTVKKRYDRRGTCVCVSDKPDGEFVLHSDGSVTPNDWECLDGTLYIEDDIPYMVFCNEWIQCGDGSICAIKLTKDLKTSIGDARVLFRASEAKHITPYRDRNYVTDGPFLFKEDGRLYMLWSSFIKNDDSGYVETLAYSENGRLDGEWKHCSKVLFKDNGGHGMIFNDLEGKRRMVLHTPNSFVNPNPKIFEFCRLKEGEYVLK